ncbi:hypothetical protein M2403_004532 [Rahnella sp. BIGb0603]|uniref:hypothetical protein n=1 Tax=Rahnella sp. BIGb0603 TaxID=2940612 RepID=UPI00216937D3|nr:hypothetical protein [Rahnella sp. BIGb0603]MCS3425899.1 hypothetical protein [Rahnella sp. BIGb0603]
MDSSHELKIALIKIRLMADIARSAQCNIDEQNMVLEMISDLADTMIEHSGHD